jgi:hypothetical protein
VKVVKPLNGIECQKFQPIIRKVQNIEIAISPCDMTPLNKVAGEYLSQMKLFHSEYHENLVSGLSKQGGGGSKTTGPKDGEGSDQPITIRNDNTSEESNLLNSDQSDIKRF